MAGRAAASGPFHHRGLAPLLWMLVSVSAVELAVTHLPPAHWWPRAALVLSVVTGGLVVAPAGLARSIGRRPTMVDGDMPRMRADWDAASRRAPGVRNLALLGWPNVVVDLDHPIGRVAAVAHRFDDPAGFARWVATLPPARGLG